MCERDTETLKEGRIIHGILQQANFSTIWFTKITFTKTAVSGLFKASKQAIQNGGICCDIWVQCNHYCLVYLYCYIRTIVILFRSCLTNNWKVWYIWSLKTKTKTTHSSERKHGRTEIVYVLVVISIRGRAHNSSLLEMDAVAAEDKLQYKHTVYWVCGSQRGVSGWKFSKENKKWETEAELAFDKRHQKLACHTFFI